MLRDGKEGESKKAFTLLKIGLLIILLSIIFWRIQFSVPWLIGYDGYFHIKLSKLYREEGLLKSLPWLEFTIYKDYFRDHHLLFHYLLIPFTIWDMMFSGKIAVVIFDVIAGIVLYLIMGQFGVRMSSLWTLIAMLSSNAFLFRISLLRVQSIVLSALLIGFFLFSRKKKVLIFIFSTAIVWLYDAFPLILLMAIIFSVSEWLIEKRLDHLNFLFCLAGIITGLTINPYFPENIQFFVYNISRTIFFNVNNVNLGSEWKPYNTWVFLNNSLPAFVLLLLTILALPFFKGVSKEGYSAFLLNFLFLFMTFKSRRFIEYWPVFAVFSSALIIGKNMKRNFFIPIVLLLILLSIFNIKNAIHDIRSSINPLNYKGSATWLMNSSSEGDVVFNADWDDFPFLFFYNEKNHYIVGLDPMFMYTYDKDKYRLYQAITEGRVMNPGRLIRREFNARFVFLDRFHPELYKTLKDDPSVKEVFEDKGGIVFEITEISETK